MRQFGVTGMSCAACVARVEKAVNAVEGIDTVAVSLLTNSMVVSGNATDEAIVKAVTDAGYGAFVKGKDNKRTSSEEELADLETPRLKKRLIASVGFLIILMYVSMGHMMWGWPIPSFLEGNHLAVVLLEMILTAIIMVINQKFFISGFKGLIHRAPNMDTLVALGASAAFIYSTVVMFLMTDALTKGDAELAHKYMMDIYFESAGTILTLITVGKMLEAKAKGKTTNALKSLMKLAPKTAIVLDGDKQLEKAIEDVAAGDMVLIKPGEAVPVDGIITEGITAVNESSMTGESIPVDKTAGDRVSAGTINISGAIKVKTEKVGADTALAQIIQMVSDAAATKAPIAKIADKVSGVFVPAVIGIAIVTIIIWLFTGAETGYALARGISVLVISCPCALGLATPVAIMVGNGVAAKNGILFKTAVALENTGRIQIVALDKTGTITKGEPEVTDIIAVDSEEELLTAAYSVERYSEHPLGKAIVGYGSEHKIEACEVTNFKSLVGNGVEAECGADKLYGGSEKYIGSKMTIDAGLSDKIKALANQGKTPLIFAKNDRLLGIIAVADVVKEDSITAVADLKKMGIKTIMLTGDNVRTAETIAKQVGVDEVVSGVLPDGKEAIIRKLKTAGNTMMVGDGINDSPALARADIGVAIGAGTDVAIDAADIVLMKNSLSDVACAIRLSRKTIRNIHENLFWAFIYNVIGIPLAAGVWIPIFGWELSPMFGAAAMSLSSFCVVTNALRINLFKPYDNSKDKKSKTEIILPELSEFTNTKEKTTMTKTIKIEGMMCMHCEKTVKKALESLEGVAEAQVSHAEGTAVVALTADISDDVLKQTVEAEDFKVTGIE